VGVGCFLTWGVIMEDLAGEIEDFLLEFGALVDDCVELGVFWPDDCVG
jgi:hypothetical protein